MRTGAFEDIPFCEAEHGEVIFFMVLLDSFLAIHAKVHLKLARAGLLAVKIAPIKMRIDLKIH